MKILLAIVDGMSYHIFEQFRYNLSDINKLVEDGSYGKLESVFPAITPVALASLFTGKLPKNHGVTSPKIFVKGSSLSKPLSAYSSYSLKADPVWYLLAKNGYKVIVLTAPQALPDKWNMNNLILFDPYKAKIKECSKGYIINPGENDVLGVKISVKIEGKYIIRLTDVDNNTLEFTLEKNEWTKPIEITMLCKDKRVKGNFRLKGLDNYIYMAPPSFLTTLWSNNYNLAEEVWNNVVSQYGMLLDGDYLSLKSKVITFKEYFETLRFAYEFFYNYSLYLLGKYDWDFAITYLPIVDNIQHLLYGVDDSRSLDHIFEVYKLASNFITAHISVADNIIICSDHGIRKVKKRVYLNKVLEKLNVLKVNGDKIDWKRTKAYYGGGGIVRINLRNREKYGIVNKNEFSKLVKYITYNLERLEDQITREKILTVIYSNESPAGDREGDIIIAGVNPRYSISTAIEKEEILEDVIPYFTITADHGYYKDEDMEGIVIFYGKLFRKGKLTNAKIIDVMPTILKIFGINIKADGRILNEVFKNSFNHT